MLCTGNMNRFCGCLIRRQTTPQKFDRPGFAPALAQKTNPMEKTVRAGIPKKSMSFFMAFRNIQCLLRNPLFAIALNLLSEELKNGKH